jgi:hypothetical protein
VDEPARRRVAGQPGAKQPKAAAGGILDPVVVADRVGSTGTLDELPIGPLPFLGDALGSVGLRDAMDAMAPGEMKWWIVG